MFGMSFTYALFGEGTDIYWARTRVLEQLGRVQQLLPPGVSPTLGPDASGVGWVYQYVLKDRTGRMDLAELRALQDFTVRPALQAVAGVAEWHRSADSSGSTRSSSTPTGWSGSDSR